MSVKLNQHFVPQFLFRLMNGGKRYIHVANRSTGAIYPFASIKGQCARHKYYGSTEIEDWLEEFERRHAATLRRVQNIAWNSDGKKLTEKEESVIREALLLQRSRTPKSVSSIKVPMQSMMMHFFQQSISSMPETEEQRRQIDAINRGEAKLEESELEYLWMSMDTALKCAPAIIDLELIIIRNNSHIPFIIGDSPVVLSNHYMRCVKNHGVLGFTTPGLMIALPIDVKTQILLYDPGVYTINGTTGSCLDIFDAKDVSMLNAVQLHESQENIYFVEESSARYVEELITCHSKLLRKSQGRFEIVPANRVSIGGQRMNSGELLQIYCDQLPITIGLSVIETKELSSKTNLNSPRNEVIATYLETTGVMRSKPSRFGGDDFVDYMKAVVRF